MRYKVGDKVRVRGDLEVGKNYGIKVFTNEKAKYKGEMFEIFDILKQDAVYQYRLGGSSWYSPEMLRPAKFKIWCETEAEKQAVLEELEKEGYRWCNGSEKPTEWNKIKNAPMGLIVRCGELYQEINDGIHDRDDMPKISPLEFTGIDFSKKIIITKTPTGATATYGDKTVTTEGDFENASRQALAEVLCPFKVGDMVKNKYKGIGEVTNIKISSDYHCVISVYHADSNHNVKYYINELEPYTEPLYNAKLFCIKDCGRFETGHIYEIKNGVFTDGNPNHTMTVSNIDELNDRFGEREECYFMEVKGGLDE